MPMIKPASIRDLKSRVNIHDVVAGVVTLRKAGASYKGLCPFHNEKSPSFHVSPDRGMYKCFGCGKGGDIISFVMETEHLAFSEAAETLARRFNVPLEFEEGGPSREERSLRQELFDLHETATEHFHQQLVGPGRVGEFMRGYWTDKRKFPLELAADFRIGAADEQGSGLGAALAKKKYSEDALRQCGLFFVREGAPISPATLRTRFRGRLMVPIRDIQGRVVAFTARQTDLTPDDDPAKEAKYVNSPETPIFTKGELLFNLDRARANCTTGPFVMVEGQLDAMRCWSAGIKTVVAPQGTAVTERQMTMLQRLNAHLDCFLDGDNAGRKAALRLLPLALAAGVEVKFLALAPGVDPDALFRDQGREAYEQLRASALDGITFACRALLPEPGKATALDKEQAVKQIFEIIGRTSSETALEVYLAQIQREWRLGRGVFEDFAAFRRNPRSGSAARAPSSLPPPTAPVGSGPGSAKAGGVEEHLLLLCVHHPEIGPALAGLVQHEWVIEGTTAGRLLNRALAAFENAEWPADDATRLGESTEETELITKLVFEPPKSDDLLKNVNEALRRIHKRFIDDELNKIQLEIAGERPDSDPEFLSARRRKIELVKQSKHPPQLSALP